MEQKEQSSQKENGIDWENELRIRGNATVPYFESEYTPITGVDFIYIEEAINFIEELLKEKDLKHKDELKEAITDAFISGRITGETGDKSNMLIKTLYRTYNLD